MKIVKVFGGMGNQMFQYALFLRLKASGEAVKLHEAIPSEETNIKELFHLPWEEADDKIRTVMSDTDLHIWNKARRKLLGKRKSYYQQRGVDYDETPFCKGELYLEGYWQCQDYFLEQRSQLLDLYCLENVLGEFKDARVAEVYKFYLDEIRSENAVSIHIRRGDYLTNKVFYSMYGNICTEQYFRNAMRYFRDKYGQVAFYLFSNDIAWVKEQKIFNAEDCKIVDSNQGIDCTSLDMLLMKNCRHNIIANSSYSWWGAWLNENENQEVVAPLPWLNNMQMTDIYCPEWIQMEG